MSAPSPQPASLSKAAVSDIDFSCRLPLLVLFISAAIWLVIAWVFELIASIKFHAPAFLADYDWLTYGRVHAGFTNSVLYGFCVQAGLGVALWLMADLGATRLAQRWLATLSAALWNLGVTIGIIGILIGDSTGFEHLEMPGYAAILAFVGYLLMALLGVLTFHQRRVRSVFPAHWFMFTALFWFAWIYSTANLLLITFPVRGVAQAVIDWWFSNNLQVVWLSLVGLAVLFYFIPRLTQRELHSRQLGFFTYWLLIVFAGWGGIPNSAPVPAWMPALSTIGTVLFVLGVIAVALNVSQTLRSSATPLRGNALLLFFSFGAVAFVLAGLTRAALALLDVTESLQFTWFGPALNELNFYGFFAMVMFGAIYAILPRLLGVGLPWPKLMRAHFWCCACGVVLLVLPLVAGGLVQHAKLEDPNVPFVAAMHTTLPFLRISTIGDLLLVIGHALFLTNIGGLVFGFYRARVEATYDVLTADLFKTAGAKP